MTPSDHALPLVDQVLEACTLPTVERPLRLAEFDRLFSTAVQQTERINALHLRLALSGSADLETVVRDLARRESQCCSFFAFTVTPHAPGRVVLDIEVPQPYVGVLDALADRAIHLRGSR